MLRILLIALCVLSSGLVLGKPYDDILRKLQDLKSKYPNLTEWVSLGTNDQGREIRGLRIELPSSFQKTPQLVVGTHHGNEVDAAPLAVAFAEKLLSILENRSGQYYNDLRDDVFYVFPVLNISGYDRRNRRERGAGGAWLDPNRDYPDACANKQDFQLKSVRNLSRFVFDKNIIGAVTIHGYVGTFTFPWGFYTSDSKSPDHQNFLSYTRYAVQANNYRVGTHKDVIYPASGSFEDWAYLEYGVWVALLEMSRRANYDKDVEALIRYFTVIPSSRSGYHNHDGSCFTRDELRNISHSDHSRP